MRYRETLSLLLLVAATACAGVSESPTAPPELEASLAKAAASDDDGEPPPPPIDTGTVMVLEGAEYGAGARYFANKPGTMSWLEFQSANGTIASQDARLMYNAKTGRTTGRGTLTNGGSTLDLSQVRFGSDGFESCVPAGPETGGVRCGVFTYGAGQVGQLRLVSRTPRSEVDRASD